MSGTCTVLDLTPECVNLRLYAGDRNAVTLEIEDDGTLVDITGWTFQATARVSKQTAVVATAVCGILDADRGLAVVEWGDLRAVIGSDDEWSGVWDVQAKQDGQSTWQTLAAGAMTVTLDVTRP